MTKENVCKFSVSLIQINNRWFSLQSVAKEPVVRRIRGGQIFLVDYFSFQVCVVGYVQFGDTCCFNFLGKRVNRARERADKFDLIFYSKEVGIMFLRNTVIQLHVYRSQKKAVVVLIALRI